MALHMPQLVRIYTANSQIASDLYIFSVLNRKGSDDWSSTEASEYIRFIYHDDKNSAYFWG